MFNQKEQYLSLLNKNHPDEQDNKQVADGPTNIPSKDNRIKAVIAMNVFSLSQAIFSITWKYVNRNGVSVVELMLCKNVFNFVAINGFLFTNKINPFTQTKGQLDWLLYRGLTGQIAFCFLVYSISLIPLSLVLIIFQTSPFWTSILGLVLNKEKVYVFEYLAMILCLSGVIGIAIGKLSDKENNKENVDGFGIAVAFVLSWLQAGSNVISRKLKNVHFAVVGFYHPLIGSFLALSYIFLNWVFTGRSLETHNYEIYGYLLIACVFDFLCLNSQNIAFQSDSSGFVAVIGYIVVLYGFLADKFIFYQPMTGYDLAGAILIFMATVGVTVYKIRQQNAQKSI